MLVNLFCLFWAVLIAMIFSATFERKILEPFSSQAKRSMFLLFWIMIFGFLSFLSSPFFIELIKADNADVSLIKYLVRLSFDVSFSLALFGVLFFFITWGFYFSFKEIQAAIKRKVLAKYGHSLKDNK